MTLRSRLSLFFVAIVVVPLLLAAVAVATLVPRELRERTDERLRGAAATAAALRSERLARASREISRIGRVLVPIPAARRAGRLESLRLEAGLDVLALGRTTSARTPMLSRSIPRATLLERGSLLVTARMPDGTTLRGGWWTDLVWARTVARASGVGVAIFVGDRIVAMDGIRGSATRAAPSGVQGLSDGPTLALAGEANGERLVLWLPTPAGSGSAVAAIAAIAGAGILLAGAIGFVLGRSIARPLTDLVRHARAIAAGDYSGRVGATGRDELAQLGRAFDAMAGSVSASVGELKQSRDELRRTLGRLGATLRSTRGMEEMLTSVLDAAAGALGAESGAIFRCDPGGTLSIEASFGHEAPQVVREAAADALREGRPVLREGFGGGDPLGRVVAAAPLHRGREMTGVIAIASGGGPEPFGECELATLASFAAQASVAIDNVHLREEAERLARTDPLTGVPNRRTLERKLEREIERANRYGHPVSVVMVDLDHFKSINDRFGHLDGDRVLVEAVARIGSVLRSGIDVLARFGGEEFVLVLPETPPEGAMTVARKVLQAMSATPFDVGGGLTVTASAGAACVPGDGPGASDLLHAADLALYRAKQDGRNRVAATAVVAGEVAPT